MPKSVVIPIEEYEREMKQMQEQARQEGFKEGQQNYLNVMKAIVLNEKLENCTIMWNGMSPEEKQIINKLIDTFIAKKPVNSTPSSSSNPSGSPS